MTKDQANDAVHVLIFLLTASKLTVGFQDSFELISQDNTSNLLVHMSMEMTTDRDGVESVKTRGTEVECSGPTPP